MLYSYCDAFTEHFSRCTYAQIAIVMDSLNPKDFIIIKGAKTHNLKNLNVAIPRNQCIVVTGLSGSGKSSLVFDTLFVEAHRMYVESLSTYARQFLGRMQKPPVDYIKGLSPAIAIEQRVSNRNPHSTVGTITELCHYLSLLYSSIGIPYSPISGQKVKKDTITDVVDYINSQEDTTKVQILYPMTLPESQSFFDKLRIEQGKGFTRVIQGRHCFLIDSLLEGNTSLDLDQPIYGLVDRIIVDKKDKNNQYRIADSLQIAFFEGKGSIVLDILGKGMQPFCDRFESDGLTFELPTLPFFSFNTPYGSCKQCKGLGNIVCIDENKVIPDPTLSIRDGAIACWRGPILSKWITPLYMEQTQFPIDTPYESLTASHQQILWQGKDDFIGIDNFFDFCTTQTHKIQYRVLLARYRNKIQCPTCKGTRIRSDAHYVKINHHSMMDLLQMPIHKLIAFFDNLSLTERESLIANRVVIEIKNRLRYLEQVGLHYLNLSRPISSLSGGEHQRIKLAVALGSPLFGTMYILDEPTIGLHPRDTHQLLDILVALKIQGNTVIIVEHEEQVMHIADTIIEIGPKAGAQGGSLVFQGTFHELLGAQTYTAKYLNGIAKIPIPTKRRSWEYSLSIQNAQLNNLKQVNLTLPLHLFTVITGVSGSGKSSLVQGVLFPLLKRVLSKEPYAPLDNHQENLPPATLVGDFHRLHGVELVVQDAFGKSSRSNPATYLGIYDYIRDLFRQTELAYIRGYQLGHFSFNSEKGQCPHCKGEGIEKIEMQFMADIILPCEVCQGNRFKAEILDVTYGGYNIAAILAMTIDEALHFFEDHSTKLDHDTQEVVGEVEYGKKGALPLICSKLKVLQEIGLGYIQLGQPSSSLSGGEQQRLKLASYLGKSYQPMLYIFDEPTTGLHMHDVNKLLIALQALVDQGDSVLVIEHNLDIIKSADWIIDLGPDGGEQGGHIVFTGTPETLIQLENNHTATYLKEKF